MESSTCTRRATSQEFWNERGDVPLSWGGWLSLRGSENWLLIATTFSLKKEAKISAEKFLSCHGGGGLINVLKVENNFRVSLELLILSV